MQIQHFLAGHAGGINAVATRQVVFNSTWIGPVGSIGKTNVTRLGIVNLLWSDWTLPRRTPLLSVDG